MYNFSIQPVLYGARVAPVPAWPGRQASFGRDAARQAAYPAKGRPRRISIMRAALARLLGLAMERKNTRNNR
jgi:hypothetical protein